MDRNRKIKIVILFFLISLQGNVMSSALAATFTPDNQLQVNVEAATQENQSKTAKLTPSFPYLQRALIIVTIVNFVIIIFALSIYIVKRRMNQFSPIPRAMGHQES